MSVFGGLKGLMAKWLGILPNTSQVGVTIREYTTRQVNTLKNQLWYRGDPVELEQFWKQLAGGASAGDSNVIGAMFWAATPSGDVRVRKVHSGLPRMIADKLAGIVAEDMRTPDMEQVLLTRWEEIAKDLDFQELLKDAISRTLAEGDGAFKISVDSELTNVPLVEFYAGNCVDFVYKRGKLQEVQFFTDYEGKDNQSYRLVEYYGKGYVRYKLFNREEHEVELSIVEEAKDLKDVIFAGEFLMAIPLRFYRSVKYKGRGDSLFETKSDAFDAFDEVLSTWVDAMRGGRVKQYIPENLIPRNEETGALQKPDVFNPYLAKAASLQEDAESKIEVVQGDVKFDGLIASYTTILDWCLLGIISPSTLGIDVKKLDNADSQREKEKTTLYTRDVIIGVLAKIVPLLIQTVLQVDDTLKNATPAGEYENTVEWGQYASPAFDTMVETVGKAKTYGIMSLEQCIEELYGDSMSEEDKVEEIARLKAEVAEVVDEPSINDEFTDKTGGDVGGEQSV